MRKQFCVGTFRSEILHLCLVVVPVSRGGGGVAVSTENTLTMLMDNERTLSNG